MANLSGEGTLSIGAKLEAAGQVLQKVSASRSTTWAVESADPQERTARATERLLELNEASREGIAALVDAAKADATWIKSTGILTVVITLLAAATLVVAVIALSRTP